MDLLFHGMNTKSVFSGVALLSQNPCLLGILLVVNIRHSQDQLSIKPCTEMKK